MVNWIVSGIIFGLFALGIFLIIRAAQAETRKIESGEYKKAKTSKADKVLKGGLR